MGVCKAGDFCWINILTPRPAEAMGFFAKVLGWTFFEMPRHGHGVRAGGKDIGGLFDIEGPGCPPGMEPVMGVMIRVENADETVANVRALGGKADHSFDVAGSGRMAVCRDPNGAAFDIWEPRTMLGTDAERFQPGVPSWSETLTTDVSRATEFYRRLFGWTAEVKPTPSVEYTVFRNDGTEIAGLMAVPYPGMKPHWGTYFAVGDIEETAKTARELGGTLFVPPTDIPETGRFSGILSPHGVRFYAIQYLPRGGS